MFKDKPEPQLFASQWRQRRTQIMTAFVLLCLFYLYSRSGQQPSAHSTSNQIDLSSQHIDWSRYAYSQYATDIHYLCNSIMIFESLHRLGSRAERILFYPKSWDLEVSSSQDRTSQLLLMAKDKYNVRLHPTDIYTLKREAEEEHESWDSSVNKLRAFEQVQYSRVLHIDSDVTLFQHLDELFLLPPAPVVMPRAYWYLPDERKLTSLIVLLEPSATEAERLWKIAAGLDKSSDSLSHAVYDMEILNARFGDSALVLPHRPYALVSGEFRKPGGVTNHTTYLGNDYEAWNAERAIKEAKLVHFSDWPLPKPWIMWPHQLLSEVQPSCEFDAGTAMEHGCEDRQVWKGLYDEFRKRRKTVCKLLSVPAPEWPPRKRKLVKADKDQTLIEELPAA